MTVVWDYYATGDRSTAKLYVVNQTSESRNSLIVSLEFFDIEGRRKYFKEVKDFNIGPNTSASAMTVGRIAGIPSTYLMRTTLDRKSTRLNSSHRCISYAVFCLKKK